MASWTVTKQTATDILAAGIAVCTANSDDWLSLPRTSALNAHGKSLTAVTAGASKARSSSPGITSAPTAAARRWPRMTVRGQRAVPLTANAVDPMTAPLVLGCNAAKTSVATIRSRKLKGDTGRARSLTAKQGAEAVELDSVRNQPLKLCRHSARRRIVEGVVHQLRPLGPGYPGRSEPAAHQSQLAGSSRYGSAAKPPRWTCACADPEHRGQATGFRGFAEWRRRGSMSRRRAARAAAGAASSGSSPG